MCAYLALNYVTSSFFYFEKTLVVARGECLLPAWVCLLGGGLA